MGAWHLASVGPQHTKLRLFMVLLGGLCARNLCLAVLDPGKSEPDIRFVKKVL